jgi:hypothetical protein
MGYLLSELISSAVVGIVLIAFGRIIFNSVIKRLEVLEKADKVLLAAVNQIQLDMSKEYVAKEDCIRYRKGLSEWITHIEDEKR